MLSVQAVFSPQISFIFIFRDSLQVCKEGLYNTFQFFKFFYSHFQGKDEDGGPKMTAAEVLPSVDKFKHISI